MIPTVKWCLYFLECKGGKIYIGIALNVAERFKVHVAGHGALFTKLNPPVRILATCEFPSKGDAMKEEARLKKLSQLEKLQWAFAYGWDGK